jgi:tetratricopeptide (TPR) repeat protein
MSDKAIRLITDAEAIALCRDAGMKRELVQALKALGQIERDLGRGDAARPLYDEAVAICREEGDTLTLAHTIRHLGDIHQDAGRMELAEPCYLEALALYRSHEHTRREIWKMRDGCGRRQGICTRRSVCKRALPKAQPGLLA